MWRSQEPSPGKGSNQVQTTLAQFNETQSQDAFALQNSKLLKVRLGIYR